MDALVMCGGAGTRLDTEREKPLFRIGNHPMVEHVLDALDASRINRVYPVVSPQTPETTRHLADQGRHCLETPGNGYVADLEQALTETQIDQPIMTVAADLPLLAPTVIDSILRDYDTGAVTVCVPVALKRLLGTSIDTSLDGEERAVTAVGLNIVDPGPEARHETFDARLAVNVNRLADAEIAEELL